MTIDLLLFVLLLVFGFAFIVAEHQSTWVQVSIGMPAVGLALAIFTRKLHPKLFASGDGLARWKQYALSLAVVVALSAVIGAGAMYLDTYHHPGREMTGTEKVISKGIIYFIIGVPIALAFLLRHILKRRRYPRQ